MSQNTPDQAVTEDQARELWNDNRHQGTRAWDDLLQIARNNVLAVLRAASKPVPVDDRWQPVTDTEPLRAGDLARHTEGDLTQIATVGSIDSSGRVWTLGGRFMGLTGSGTWDAQRATPTHHRLPERRAARLDDVTGRTHGWSGFCATMALTAHGLWYGVDSNGSVRAWAPENITACTLDGVRLENDGVFEDGTARFREED